MAART